MDGIRAALAANRTVLYITNSMPYFFSHRLMLAQEASRRGFGVVLAGRDVLEHSERLRAEEITPVAIPDIKRGISPLGDLRAASAIATYVRTHGISVVHASGLKTMFICALANFRTRMPRVVCVVTGLGSLYVTDTVKTRTIRFGIETILRPLLRRRATLSVFQNRDDHAYFLKKGIVRADNSVVIKGSGVDTQEYPFVEEPESDKPLVIFPARLLKSKGAMEFATAAGILLSKGADARFALVGDLDPDNPDTLTENDLARLRTKGNVEFWGFRKDMASVFAQCHIVCLPSYREGVPKALIEAASVGRAIVTTDAPGCREIVIDGGNGLLVPPRDPQRLADALEMLILDRSLRKKMGLVGRRMVEQEFAASVVIAATADLYEARLIGAPSRAS